MTGKELRAAIVAQAEAIQARLLDHEEAHHGGEQCRNERLLAAAIFCVTAFPFGMDDATWEQMRAKAESMVAEARWALARQN